METNPKRDNTTPSCAVCQKRKVKCNRVQPCAPCLKTGLECVFPEPQRRRKRVKRSDSDAEDSGPHNVPSASPSLPIDRKPPSPVEPPSTGRLVSDGAGYRYVNNHLWHALPPQPSHSHSNSPATSGLDGSTPRNSINTPGGPRTGDSGHESSYLSGSDTTTGRSFIFGHHESPGEIAQVSPNHINQLWQVYLENVDPMMKILHAPTVQQLVLLQVGRPPLPPNEQALISAIYLSSAVSMQDDFCRASFQESRASLIAKFRLSTEAALSSARFVITTDIMVLQALVLYLVALRSEGETQTVWSICGLAIRIAGTVGLNRDGSHLELPAFDTEMRRRLHWAIVYLDARTAELVGQDGDLLVQNHDVKPPSNLNDSELFPSMRRLPEPRTIPTEMLYVQFRATLATHIRAVAGTRGAGSTWKKMGSPDVPRADKLEIIQKLEERFGQEILAGCDPGVPLQQFTINAVQTFLTKMRLVAEGRSERYSSGIFELSMKIMNLQMELWVTPCLQRWLWHSKSQFQWFPLTCLLRQTRLRAPGPTTLRAWSLIRKIFDVIIPTLEMAPTKSTLLDSIQGLWSTGTQGQTGQVASRPTASAAMPAPLPHAAQSLPPPFSSAVDMSYSKSGYGSRPHNGLLPGMLEEPVPFGGVSMNVGDTMEFQDPFLDLDFDAIDWAEFDRLTKELCEQ